MAKLETRGPRNGLCLTGRKGNFPTTKINRVTQSWRLEPIFISKWVFDPNDHFSSIFHEIRLFFRILKMSTWTIPWKMGRKSSWCFASKPITNHSHWWLWLRNPWEFGWMWFLVGQRDIPLPIEICENRSPLTFYQAAATEKHLQQQSTVDTSNMVSTTINVIIALVFLSTSEG